MKAEISSAQTDLIDLSVKPDFLSRIKKAAAYTAKLAPIVAALVVGGLVWHTPVDAFWLVVAAFYYIVSEIAKLTGDAK